MTVRDALNSALDEEMANDQSVYILGEEVRDMSASLRPHLLPMRAVLMPHCWWSAGGRVPGSLQGQSSSRTSQCSALSADANPHFQSLQITRGLLQKYGSERVRDTPITEVRSTAAVDHVFLCRLPTWQQEMQLQPSISQQLLCQQQQWCAYMQLTAYSRAAAQGSDQPQDPMLNSIHAAPKHPS
jgi:hypothetical protein